jgi:hypothetical protein
VNPLSLPLILVYAFTLWLGVYLLQRAWAHPGARYTGIGLIAFVIGLVAALLLPRFDAYPLLAVIPAVCWFLSMRYFIQSNCTSNETNEADQMTASPEAVHSPDADGFTARQLRRRRVIILIWVATVFFTGGVGLIFLPQIVQLPWLSMELVLMGWGIVILQIVGVRRIKG